MLYTIVTLNLIILFVEGSCISESIELSGIEEGDNFSNKAELEQINVASLKSFKTCKNRQD